MKKLFLLLMLTIIGSIAASASYRVYDVNSKKYINNYPELPGYELSIEETDSSTIVSYTFSKYAVMMDDIFTGKYYISLAGFGEIDTPTFPRFPIRTENILVPDCESYKFSILEHQVCHLKLEASPARPPLKQSSYDEYTYSNVPPVMFSPGRKILPEKVAYMNEPQIYRGQKFVNLTICPVQYSYNSNYQITFSQKLVIEITHGHIYNDGLSEYIQPADNFLRRNIASPELRLNRILPIRTSVESTQSMLIISTYTIDTAADDLANWKRKMGLNVEVKYDEYWSYEDVQATIRDWYDSNPDAYFVVLLGDHNNIEPKMIEGDDETYPSDFSFSALDGDEDCVPDIYIGRIPASNYNEALSAVNKIISYEKSPFGNSSKSKLYCAAYFQDGRFASEADGYEDRDFVRTSVKILECIGKKFNFAKEIFCSRPWSNPKYWSKSFFDGSEIPSWLQKPDYSWNGSTQDIINAFNNGASLIVHRDHGCIDGWGDPSFYTSSFNKLNNTEYPILLSMNCQTGKYTEPNNFTKGLICASNGAVSAISATRVSYSGYNDAFTIGILASAFPNEGLIYERKGYTHIPDTSEPVNSLGEMLSGGLMYMYNTYGYFPKANETAPINNTTLALERDMFHCFGDPSLHFAYKSNETLKNETSFSTDGENAVVTISGENAFISFYDQNNGLQTRFYGKQASFPVHNPESLYISVTRSGEAPITGTFAELADVTLEDINKPLIIESAFILNSSVLYIDITRNPQLNRFLIMPAQLRITPITGSLSFGGKTYDITTEGGHFRYPISDFMLSPNYQFIQIDVILNGKVVDSVKIR